MTAASVRRGRDRRERQRGPEWADCHADVVPTICTPTVPVYRALPAADAPQMPRRPLRQSWGHQRPFSACCGFQPTPADM